VYPVDLLLPKIGMEWAGSTRLREPVSGTAGGHVVLHSIQRISTRTGLVEQRGSRSVSNLARQKRIRSEEKASGRPRSRVIERMFFGYDLDRGAPLKALTADVLWQSHAAERIRTQGQDSQHVFKLALLRLRAGCRFLITNAFPLCCFVTAFFDDDALSGILRNRAAQLFSRDMNCGQRRAS